jgi:hypothetical protein
MPLFDHTKTGIIRPYHSMLTLVQRALDVAMIVLALWLTMALYADLSAPEPWDVHDTLAAGAASLLFLFAADACGLYEGFRGVPLVHELKRVWLAWFIVFAGCSCWPSRSRSPPATAVPCRSAGWSARPCS